ncbi:CoA transferase subunit A [Chloroflexota bacterium]
MSINKLVGSFDEAVADIFDGAVILIGEFGPTNDSQSHLVEALSRRNAKSLTLVINTPVQRHHQRDVLRITSPGFENGRLLVENGQVNKIICTASDNPQPGTEITLGGLPAEEKLEVELVSRGTLSERIRAAKAGIPAFFIPARADSVTDQGKESRIIDGNTFVLEYALKADFALVKAHKADRWGNLVYQDSPDNFNVTIAGAAGVTVAEVDKVVPLGELDPETIATPSIYVNRVVSGQPGNPGES